jgi:hypothetical protein
MSHPFQGVGFFTLNLQADIEVGITWAGADYGAICVMANPLDVPGLLGRGPYDVQVMVEQQSKRRTKENFVTYSCLVTNVWNTPVAFNLEGGGF